MNKITFVFTIAVASASCYDFLNSDSLFELSINRFKRADAMRDIICCGNDFSGHAVESLGDLTQECLPRNDINHQNMKETINMYICLHDCVAKNEGTVHDGEVDKEKVMEFLRNYDQDEYRMKVFEENLDKCISEAKSIQESLAGKTRCDPKANSLIRCLLRELLENCPEDKQNMEEKETCGRIKQSSRHPTFDAVFK